MMLLLYMGCHCDVVIVQGLATINQEVKTLAEKARNGTLQPHEFQVGQSSLLGGLLGVGKQRRNEMGGR